MSILENLNTHILFRTFFYVLYFNVLMIFTYNQINVLIVLPLKNSNEQI